MSDNDYTFGNQHDVPEGGDQRREFRLTGRAMVALELEAADPGVIGDSRGGSRWESFTTRDLSAAGCRLRTTEPLTPGALFPARIGLDDTGDYFELMAEVVWCKPESTDDDDCWLVGLRLLESDGTGYVEWVETVARVMESD